MTVNSLPPKVRTLSTLSSSTNSTSNNTTVWMNPTVSNTTTNGTFPVIQGTGNTFQVIPPHPMPSIHPQGLPPGKYDLADGAILHVKENGGYEIDDRKAKTIYKGCRVLEFNRYINASDLLEEFISYVDKLNVTQSDFMELPISLFINWLVVQAAQADGDPIPDNVHLNDHPALLARRKYPKCRGCGRFIPKRLAEAGFEFCNTLHAQQKLGIA